MCVFLSQKMWPCVEKQLSHTATRDRLGMFLELLPMPLMETVNLITEPVHAATLQHRPTPGGGWTCWSPTWSTLSSSPTEETAVQTGSMGQRFTSETLYETMVLQTQCKWTYCNFSLDTGLEADIVNHPDTDVAHLPSIYVVGALSSLSN